MASNLHVKIDRMLGRGAEDNPFYAFHFQNSQACNGRGIDVLLCLSYEDVQALNEVTRYITQREGDNVSGCAARPGTSPTFKEIPREAVPHSTKKFITKEGDIL